MENRIKLVRGDITQLWTDAIVNAANKTLLGGGGVDGAIHRAAGPELVRECMTLNGCETGQAKITGAYYLHAKHVIHTVGPVWRGGNEGEHELLASCYYQSLKLAKANNCTSIAFPNVSTGVYRFPKEMAARIALSEVRIFLQNNPIPEEVIFCCYDEESFQIYINLLN